jgi:hypothetical protein
MLVSRSAGQFALQTSVALACLALASCDGAASGATPSPATDACTVAVVMVPIKALYDTADTQATVGPNNGDLRCVSGIARITVLLGAVSAPSDGPQGSPHLVLLEDDSGSWVVANDKLCNTNGLPAKPIPPELGDVCGVQ